MSKINVQTCTRKIMQSYLCTLVLFVAFVVALAIPKSASALDIRNDLGGAVSSRIAKVEQLRAAGIQVRILGTCVSACTLYLGLPNTCVATSARLGFHGPSTRLKSIPLPRQEFERISRQMATYYPGKIRKWFMSQARMRTGSYYTISGTQAIAMGARPCTET
ncbi:hypothetical protein [Pseudorhodobacter wandonensis]|jgi:hypothetical protein|uniref:hypothetical protein n=1 Tax=Pseudorhodobacter wandonensis TaxID=1120568 RepID=UPI00067CD6E9|nr:hypothetical protein [Pseudorhodobacter wandonensis]